jgi:hypothetical protein
MVMEQTSDLEVVEERDAAAYGFMVRARANGLLHRILPLRDPQQPRFWCVVVFRCSPGGVPDESERPWVGPGGLKREALKDTMGAIRADPSTWLAEPAHRALRAWMLAPAEVTATISQSVSAAGAPTTDDALHVTHDDTDL